MNDYDTLLQSVSVIAEKVQGLQALAVAQCGQAAYRF
jgi:hypothetical protein